jgi:hypothetical protein
VVVGGGVVGVGVGLGGGGGVKGLLIDHTWMFKSTYLNGFSPMTIK